MAWSSSPGAPPTIRAPTQTFPCGDERAWSIAVTNVDGSKADLTGYTAQWVMGIPPAATMLGLLNVAYTAAGISVTKTSGAGLDLISVNGAWSLRFTLVKADTVNLPPRAYWQQAIVFDPSGNPVTVAEGIVNLTPSLLSLETA